MAQNSNPIAGLNKQKMYLLIFAALGLISLLLSWAKISAFGMSHSQNGLKGEGLIALLGVVGLCVAALMGDKAKTLDTNMRYVALGSFGAIILAALLVFLSIKSPVKPGLGLFLAFGVGILGLLLLLGVVKPPKALDDKVDNLS
jgi:small basic protein